MIWLNLAWNGEEGWTKVRANFSRVPTYGERLEFWGVDGAAAEVHPELDGNTFFVEEVNWITRSAPGGVAAEPMVFIVPKAEFRES